MRQDFVPELKRFAIVVWRRFVDDRCMRVAAALSYTTLLSVVPLSAIAFAILRGFPVFKGVRADIQTWVFQNFLPDAIENVNQHLDHYIANTGGMTALGIVGLAVTAILLFATIESALNEIFRVAQARALIPRLLIFWSVITLGPLLMGASFSVGGYVFIQNNVAQIDMLRGLWGWVTRLLPTLLSMAAFTVFYTAVPNRPVRLMHGLIGGVIAGLLFALLRKGFTLYVLAFPAYETMYGAVSSIPFFLVWLFLSWAVVLIGAVVCAALPSWATPLAEARAAGGAPLRPGEKLALAVEVAGHLDQGARTGELCTRETLTRDVHHHGDDLDAMLEILEKAGIIALCENGRYLFARDLDSVTILDLYRALGLDVELQNESARQTPWRAALARTLRGLGESQHDHLARSLKTIVRPE
ncbi:YihY family inner membrane protein [Varunaivibrio sulfuroxidans]|uniref:UPF0761 membrane protein EDD55_11144 n=1 Tax=Varunaivibrio sulfuroxidans TaxID=1773489 RepID=A0A4R3J658_9PROT|nr:YihY family inner membrane protein [Varunaivibrio sulfuroxidans]TCS60343.1 tRNA-processing RNAse BN [Varunaivibrio sulfuroxidans]WES30970.1 YihY family inner membrane protein [Varunaivibrio sulfuroxidans]